MLRRRVSAAWDLAFNWVVDEPHEHHAAMPISIILSTVALALLWGWTREAAVIALAWTGVLRVGEVVAATRQDLILALDSAPGVWYALLLIRSPKTRGRAARHQSSRIDPEDVVCLLEAIFGRLTPTEFLWHHSPSTLRRRFATLQHLAWPYDMMAAISTRSATYVQVEPRSGFKQLKTQNLSGVKEGGFQPECLRFTCRRVRFQLTIDFLTKPEAE